MHICGRKKKKNTFSWCFYDLLCSINVKLCVWDISYLGNLEVDREYFSFSLCDLWLLQKCEIEFMSISILPYDNINNWGDLGFWGERERQGVAFTNGVRENGNSRFSGLNHSPSGEFGFCVQWFHTVWFLMYSIVYQGGDMKRGIYEIWHFSHWEDVIYGDGRCCLMKYSFVTFAL